MGKIEFPTTTIGAVAKDDFAQRDHNNAESSGFIQPTLEGLEPECLPEMELGNCVVTTAVTYRKRVKGNEWHCHVHAEPDLLHPEQAGEFEAHATNAYADMAQRFHLRPGDRALLRGTLHPQTIELANGETATVNHFFVTSLEVLARSKRTRITVYEKEQSK